MTLPARRALESVSAASDGHARRVDLRESRLQDHRRFVTLPSLPATGPLNGPLVPLVLGSRVVLREAALDRLSDALGADKSGYFACPIPGHPARATILHLNGDWRLACSCTGRERSLAEVWAARAYGTDERRSNVELAVWHRRLAWELGAVRPVVVELPPLPCGAPAVSEIARSGFGLLLGLRRIDYPARPVPFAVRFAAAWCGLSKTLVARAIRDLRDHDVIRMAGKHHELALWDAGRGQSHAQSDANDETGGGG